MEKLITDIVNNHRKAIFLSPHLDDAIFSAGGLICELVSNKIQVFVFNVFTKSSYPYTLSAKSYLKQCKYKDADLLYARRVEEDAQVFNKLGIKPKNLNYEDALFRKIPNPCVWRRYLCKYFPELIHVYPVYRLNIIRGNILKFDRGLEIDLEKNIRKLGLSADDYLFAPMGIGNHKDHLIVNKVARHLSRNLNVILWADFPYFANRYDKSKFANLYDIENTDNLDKKIKLISMYKTQVSAIFPGVNIPKIPEYYKICKKICE